MNYLFFLPLCACVFVAANGAVQNSGKRNQDESILERRVGPGPKGGPSPKREGGGRHVANGEMSGRVLIFHVLVHPFKVNEGA